MRASHDGDRVSREVRSKKWRRVNLSVSERALMNLARQRGQTGDLANLSGAYACSLPEIDRIVDLACRLPGVQGAQLAGAGLGGCVMALVQQEHAASALEALGQQGIEAAIFRPIAGACRLVMG